MNIRIKLSFIILISFLLQACEQNSETYQPTFTTDNQNQQKTYILGIHPLHNPQKLFEVFNPLVEYLSKETGTNIKVEASKDYPSYDKKLASEAFDFGLPNPFQTINSFNYHYEVINQVGSTDLFRGTILVRKDSDINAIEDLKGKSIAYPAPTALAATMMPQYFLQTNGLNLKTDTKTHYVGSQESSMMNVYLKKTAAAATWPIPWIDLQKNKPKIASQLKVAWQTSTLPNNSFTYHKNKVPKELANKIRNLLANLHTHAEGIQLLKRMNIEQIHLASNQTYQPVVEFVKNFKQVIGDNHLLSDK